MSRVGAACRRRLTFTEGFQLDDLDAFRQEVRQWLDTHCPVSMRGPGPEEMVMGGSPPALRHRRPEALVRAHARQGLVCPGWPAQYGGGGLDAHRVRVLQGSEMRRMKCRVPQVNIGIWMLGPVLLGLRQRGAEGAFPAADDARRAGLVPRLLGAECRFDLASLKTAARGKRGRRPLCGQRRQDPNCGADQADWMYALVRTDPAAPKHLGISLLLIDMEQ